MTQNAAQAASARPGGADAIFHGRSIRRLVALTMLALAGLAAGPALAGDRALIDHIGYSQDLRYFAFEEFGIQDGSGFAYSNIYVIDIASDAWVVGTPIRVRAETENRSLSAIRREALAEAAGHIADLGLAVPVDQVALIGDGEPDQDGKSLVFGAPGYAPGEVRGEHVLTLSTFPAEATSPCMEWFGRTPLGFALTIDGDRGERQVHRDDNLPRSRGCPFDYRLYGVVMPFGAAGLDHALALVSVYPGGFEGPDRRFLAVPLAPR